MRFAVSAVFVGAILGLLYVMAQGLAPVKSVTFAAGGQGGGYWALAERYRTILARDGITVTILETAGSAENVRKLAEGAADVALIQGGIDGPDGTEALAAVFIEPFFVFSRDPLPGNLGSWSGLAIAAGAEGSGTRAASDKVFAVAGIAGRNTLLPLSSADAAEALLQGEADVAVFVAPLAAPYLEPLFQSSDVQLVGLDHTEAIVGRLRQSAELTLPAGAVSLAPLMPAEDVSMIALTARLVASNGLHPSLVDRLVEAAKDIHGARDVISREGDFPTAEGLFMDVDVYAGDLLRNGTSPLQQYLPYWVVAQINRFAILLVPIFLLVFPLLRALPGLYQWRMRHLVNRRYVDIQAIDKALEDSEVESLQELDARLRRIDHELSEIKLPIAYRNYAYSARLHIDMLRHRISDRQQLSRASREA